MRRARQLPTSNFQLPTERDSSVLRWSVVLCVAPSVRRQSAPMRFYVPAVLTALSLLAPAAAAPLEPVDAAMNARIRAEGLERSQVQEVVDHLVTVIGPRLTGSPAHEAAAEWARARLVRDGLSNVHLEPWDFGRGWELAGFDLEMTGPRYMPLIGYPEAWSASTAGTIEGTPIFIGDKTADQIDAMRAELKGRIVLTAPLQTEFVRAD